MKRNLIRIGLIMGAVMLLVVGVASAHEGRDVGPYHIAFGWRNEPLFAGEYTGPEIFIREADTSTPEAAATQASGDDDDDEAGSSAGLANLDINLKAEVSFGDQTTSVTFEPAYGEEGHYIADLIPTMPGDYTFHVTGNIGDTQVDETFTSADGKFGTVNPSSDIEFPSAQSLGARISTLEEQVAALQATVTELQNK